MVKDHTKTRGEILVGRVRYKTVKGHKVQRPEVICGLREEDYKTV